MPRIFLYTAVSSCLIALCALGLEGLERSGVWGGCLVGALVGLLSAAWLWHTASHRPSQVMRASMEGFLILLAGLLLSALSVRFIPAAQEVADWRFFIIAYAAGAFVPLIAGTVESAGVLKGRSVA